LFSGEATVTNFIVFALTQPGIELTIYHTLGEHVNHNNIDTVIIEKMKLLEKARAITIT